MPDFNDTFIEGTTDVTALGDLVEAGLPNITGTLQASSTVGYRDASSQTGAFSVQSSPELSNYIAPSSSYKGYPANFDASRSSSIYGNSDTVQPQSIRIFILIKY